MEHERTKIFVTEKDRNKDLKDNLTYEKIKTLEKEYDQIINDLWEELGQKYVGKWFYWEHKKKENVAFDEDYLVLLYIYKVKGQHLSGIEFNGIDICRRGHFVPDFNWKELPKEKASEEVMKYFDLFHFNEVFEVIT